MVCLLQLLTGVVQPYVLSVFASAAVAKTLMIYPLPPITDVMGLFRIVKVMSNNLRSVILLSIGGSIVNTVLISRMQNKAATRVHKKLSETSVFVS